MLNLVTFIGVGASENKRRVQGLAGVQQGSFLSELGTPLCWKLEERGVAGSCAILKGCKLSSGDSSKKVRERGNPKLPRIYQNLAKFQSLEEASSLLTTYYVQSA